MAASMRGRKPRKPHSSDQPTSAASGTEIADTFTAYTRAGGWLVAAFFFHVVRSHEIIHVDQRARKHRRESGGPGGVRTDIREINRNGGGGGGPGGSGRGFGIKTKSG